MNRPLAGVLAGIFGACSLAAGGPAAPAGEISPEIAAEIKAGLPAFGQSKKAPPPAPAPDPAAQQMAAHIKHLPQSQFHPPKGEEILTATGRAEAAMNQYLGPADGFDRVLLNRVTLPELWSKIPVLKYLPCPLPGLTNEDRATAIKAEVDYRQALRDETDFGALGQMEQTHIP